MEFVSKPTALNYDIELKQILKIRTNEENTCFLSENNP